MCKRARVQDGSNLRWVLRHIYNFFYEFFNEFFQPFISTIYLDAICYEGEDAPPPTLTPQISRQMGLGTYLQYEKSIMGWFKQPGQYWKNSLGQLCAVYEGGFFCFRWQNLNLNFFENIVAPALKRCMEKGFFIFTFCTLLWEFQISM